MAKNEKTLADFNKLVEETKNKYNQTKMDYNLNYTFKSETHEGFESFFICNSLNGTKLLYSHEMKIIVNREMIMSDVATLTEMKATL
jgi:hypothetical protein